MTSAFEAARTSRIRSASWAVVIEPSTSDRSYGPSTIALVASRKSASSTAPASASSSSSRSSSESWQPSQEANFQTASFGLAAAHSSRTSSQRRDRRVAVDGPVAADQRRPELAVAAEADAAVHVPLHRDVDPLGRDAARRASASTAKRIMISGPQTKAVVASGRSAARATSFATKPTRPAPARRRRRRPSPATSSRARQSLELRACTAGRPACARRRAGCTSPKLAAALERVQHDRPRAARARSRRRRRRRRRRAAASTGHALPNGPRTPSTAPGSRRADRARSRRRRRAPSARPARGRSGRAADRDRHLADPEGVDHHELARADDRRGAGAGSSSSVHVSTVSCAARRDAERQRASSAPARRAQRRSPSP